MMKNSNISASKNVEKTGKNQQQNNSPRSPLKVKDFNISSSFSSSISSSTSISSDAPTGCLRFFLSHHSSNVNKNASSKKPKSIVANNAPNSALKVKPLKGKLTGNGKNCNNLKNPEKPTSKNVQKLKKKTPPNPCLYPWKSGKKPISRSDFSDNCSKNAANFTPVNKMVNGCSLGSSYTYDKTVKLGENDADSSDGSSPIPPIQASVSPEIQGGSTSVVKATPNTCYAAGHVLSGVSDKRKCRPRGILTIGNNDLFGSSNTKVFCSEDEGVIGCFSKPRVSLVPSPAEALMHWNLSPCDERRSMDKEDDHGESGGKLDEYEMSKSIGCESSPSSSLGFSSDLCNKSSSTVTTSEATTVSHSNRGRSSEFRGLLGPSFDHMVISPSLSSTPFVPSSKVDVSPKEYKCRHDYERGTTPCSENSIGSGNVIQTPQSNSSSQSFELSHLSRDEISRMWFESELDSVAEVLRRVSLSPGCETPMRDSSRTSFEFDPLIRPDNSIDFAIFRKAIDNQSSPRVPEYILSNQSDSEVRISWREGLANRIFEMDELDCCRCFSDDEDDVNGCSDPCPSSLFQDVVDPDFNKVADNSCETTNLADVEDKTSQEDAKRFPSEGTAPCPDSKNGSESSDVADDSTWKVCYENHLFQV